MQEVNCDIMGNMIMDLIGYRKNICDGLFLSWIHEGKINFIIIFHGCTISPPKAKTICNAVRPHIFVTGYLSLYTTLLEKEGGFTN